MQTQLHPLFLLSLHLIYHLSLAHYLTTRIILGLTLITGIPLYIIGYRSVFKEWESVYFRLLSFLPLLVLSVLLFPFLGMVIVFSFVGWFIDTEQPVHYEDSKIRVVSYFAGPLGPPHLGIYEKQGWLEKDHTIPGMFTSQIDSIQVRYDTDSTRILIFNTYYDGEPEDYFPRVISLEKIE